MAVLALLAAFGVPLLMAALLTLAGARGMVWRLMPFAALPALALALLAPVSLTMPVTVRLDWLILGAQFGLDGIARVFLGLTAVLWVAAGAAARHWLHDDPRGTGFGICFLLAMAGNLGLILAQDALSFYALFALMSFAAFGLVVHTRSKAAIGAAQLYIIFVIAGELALFAGLALAAGQAQTLLLSELRIAPMSDLAAALLIIGFATKLGLMPLHFWLPPAHGAAPVPASAVLSGAMIKAGLYGMMVTLPLGIQAFEDHATVIMAAGLISLFAAALTGVQQTNPKAVLGFSSVSQMGIIALGLGAALMVPQAWPVILPVLVFQATHHAMSKGALFLGAGAWAAQPGWRGRVLLTGAVLVPALVLAGLPFSSGALGKEALKTALAEGSPVWLPWLIAALTLSGIATTLLMARFVVFLWRSPPAVPPGARVEGLVLPFLSLVIVSGALPLLWPALVPGWAGPVNGAAPGAFWPVLAGMGLAAGAALYAHTVAVGTAALLRQVTAPFVLLWERVALVGTRARRALRQLAQTLPATLEARGIGWRLGQGAIAALILLVLILEALAL